MSPPVKLLIVSAVAVLVVGALWWGTLSLTGALREEVTYPPDEAMPAPNAPDMTPPRANWIDDESIRDYEDAHPVWEP